MKLYLNMVLVKELGVKAGLAEKTLPLKDHADGIVGALMVFDNEEAARAYAPSHDVLILEVSDSKSKEVV